MPIKMLTQIIELVCRPSLDAYAVLLMMFGISGLYILLDCMTPDPYSD
jgi:hypothetical protein